MDDILEKLPDPFLVRELMAKTEEKTPYTVVALQECERMNNLTIEIRRSLKELNLGLKVINYISDFFSYFLVYLFFNLRVN